MLQLCLQGFSSRNLVTLFTSSFFWPLTGISFFLRKIFSWSTLQRLAEAPTDVIEALKVSISFVNVLRLCALSTIKLWTKRWVEFMHIVYCSRCLPPFQVHLLIILPLSSYQLWLGHTVASGQHWNSLSPSLNLSILLIQDTCSCRHPSIYESISLPISERHHICITYDSDLATVKYLRTVPNCIITTSHYCWSQCTGVLCTASLQGIPHTTTAFNYETELSLKWHNYTPC